MEPFFRDVDHEQTDKPAWNELYIADVTPWNMGKEAAPLRYLLDDGLPNPSLEITELRRRSLTRCLVPGCGQVCEYANTVNTYLLYTYIN
jgi:hypothetical protein